MYSLNTFNDQPDTPNNQSAARPVDVSDLYDQYAASLLGVISRMVNEKDEAVLLLEKTFTQVREQIGEFNPKKQLLFAWLLNIARINAREAIETNGRHLINKLQLVGPTDSVRIVSSTISIPTSVPLPTDNGSANLKKMLDCVLFENCTPEEAAASAGIPAEEARQQLRQAMQTLRARG